MPMSVSWLRGGRSRRIRFTVSCWLRRIFSRRLDDPFQSFLDGAPALNSKGFLVRADLPRETTSAPIGVAPPPGLISPWVHDRQGS